MGELYSKINSQHLTELSSSPPNVHSFPEKSFIQHIFSSYACFLM